MNHKFSYSHFTEMERPFIIHLFVAQELIRIILELIPWIVAVTSKGNVRYEIRIENFTFCRDTKSDIGNDREVCFCKGFKCNSSNSLRFSEFLTPMFILSIFIFTK